MWLLNCMFIWDGAVGLTRNLVFPLVHLNHKNATYNCRYLVFNKTVEYIVVCWLNCLCDKIAEKSFLLLYIYVSNRYNCLSYSGHKKCINNRRAVLLYDIYRTETRYTASPNGENVKATARVVGSSDISPSPGRGTPFRRPWRWLRAKPNLLEWNIIQLTQLT